MNQRRTALRANKSFSLTELTANDLKRVQGYLKVETQGIVYEIKFSPSDRSYSARDEDGQYYSNANLAELIKELKSDAAPFVHCAVTVDDQEVGHIMNQRDWFFYRPANSKGDLDTEKLHFADDVLESLNARSVGIFKKLKWPIHRNKLPAVP